MSKANQTSASIKYNLFIILSTLDLAAAIGGGLYGITLIISNKQFVIGPNRGFYPMFSIPTGRIFGIILLCVSGLLAVLYPLLAKKRQQYRDLVGDLVEYDEFGNQIKRNDFSKLSKQERDEIERQKTIMNEQILPTTLLRTATHRVPENPEKELNDLIGLESVKNEVDRMKARMEFERGGDKKKRKKGQKTNVLSSMSQVYLGNPGTGKTTVARIMAGFLYQYGYIKKPQTIEVDGNFFNGLSRGESSERAKLLIQKARGGVLFIDEAYALLGPDQDQSVIATLVAAIENYRDDTVFIFAGYTNETLKMLDSNPGFKSRIKYILDFPDYSRTDMQKIFLSMAHDLKFKVSNELLAAVGERTDSMRQGSDFGNARTVRTLLDQIINEHAVNCRAEEDPEKRMALTLADLPPA